MRVLILACCLLSSVLSQYLDPVVVQPLSNLYAIPGPIYVEQTNLSPLVAPYPIVTPPIISQPVLAPSPYNPYQAVYTPLYDQDDEVSQLSNRYDQQQQQVLN